MRISEIAENISIGSLFAERYQITAVLGQGAVGKVFCAHDTKRDGELVAVKILCSSQQEEFAAADHFLAETELTRTVAHPNVVRIFDTGVAEGMPYFTMEYISGPTLQEIIRGKKIEAEFGLRILRGIAMALRAIHEKGIIHRDLKPSNIIISSEEKIKVMDFGVASSDRKHTRSVDDFAGSATHMAPEIWQQDEITKAADIYALGVISYELLTGVLPFTGGSAYEIMWKHIRHRCVPPREYARELPGWLNEIIEEMLSKNPLDRPSASKVLDKLNLRDLQSLDGKSPSAPDLVSERLLVTRSLGDSLSRHTPLTIAKPQSTRKRKNTRSYLKLWRRRRMVRQWVTIALFLLVTAYFCGLLERWIPPLWHR